MLSREISDAIALEKLANNEYFNSRAASAHAKTPQSKNLLRSKRWEVKRIEVRGLLTSQTSFSLTSSPLYPSEKTKQKKKIFASRSRRFPSPTDIDVFIRLNLCAASKCLIICNGDSLGCLRYVVMLSAEREWEMAEWEGRLNHPALLGEPLKRIEWGSTNFYFQRHIL